MAKVGQPTKLNSEVQKRIVEALEKGNYLNIAVKYAGIDESTFYNWMKWGEEKGEGEYFQFFKAVREAEVKAEIDMVEKWSNVINSSPDTHQAIRDFMERRYRTRWGRNEKITLESDKLEKLFDKFDEI